VAYKPHSRLQHETKIKTSALVQKHEQEKKKHLTFEFICPTKTVQGTEKPMPQSRPAILPLALSTYLGGTLSHHLHPFKDDSMSCLFQYLPDTNNQNWQVVRIVSPTLTQQLSQPHGKNPERMRAMGTCRTPTVLASSYHHPQKMPKRRQTQAFPLHRAMHETPIIPAASLLCS
jgi:hypothetical protein